MPDTPRWVKSACWDMEARWLDAACPAKVLNRGCTGGFSTALASRTSRRRRFCSSFTPCASSACTAPTGAITYNSIDSILAKRGDDVHADRARIGIGAGSSDPTDRAAVAAAPDSRWGTETEVRGEFSVTGSPKVVSWCPSLGTKVGMDDPPTKKKLCGDGDPTLHPDYGLLEAQANFRARNEAYTLFRTAWGARAGTDLTVVPPRIRASTPKACKHFARSV